MSTLSSRSRSIDESTTGSSSAAVAVAVGHRDGDVKSKSSRANKKITADERKSDGYNLLKENGCHTTDDTGTDLTDSIAKEATHNNDVDEDASIQSQSQPQDLSSSWI
eukprot:scaffold15599_cov120-Skeletonema_menzelii.AAC.2